MEIREFADMDKFEDIMNNWAKATGLATVAVGADGKYISGCYNFTDFCIKLTRGSKEGCRRCEKCDREGKGVYHCHAGLIDFGIDLVVEGQKVGSVIGGQVLNNFINAEYSKKINGSIIGSLTDGVNAANHLVEEIKKKTGELRSIQSKQKILALNASIEAARAGELGAGFSVVANEVGKLSEKSSSVNKDIEDIVTKISDVVSSMKS